MRTLTSKEYAPTRHLLNPQREYVKSDKTDIRETFRRVMEQMEQGDMFKECANRRPT